MAAEKIVRALDATPERMLDFIYDSKSGNYFTPYNPLHDSVASLHAKGITGASIVAAILDTGLLSHHPMLRGKIVDAVDFTGEGTEDLNGHGTIAALIMASMAPGMGLLNVKVLDQHKEGLEEDLVAGLEWAAKHGAMVVNMSLGIERDKKCDGACPVCSTARRLGENGVVITAAAGNRPDRFYCPASSGDVISVGATDYSNTRKAEYSAAADIYAPGSVIMVPVGKSN